MANTFRFFWDSSVFFSEILILVRAAIASMQERTLSIIALIVCVVGMALLFLASQAQDMPLTTISQAQQMPAQSSVRIRGKITSVRNTGKAVIAEIEQQCSMRVMMVEDRPATLDLGAMVELTGTISDYQGMRSLSAERLVVVG